jgi:hypothetical protein
VTIWLAKSYQEVIEMRISILSILIALTVVVAGPLAFAGQDQITEQETVTSETLSEIAEVNEMSEVADTEVAKEDCTNNVDDDGDTKIDCDDSDCAEDPGCKGGY